MLQPTTQGSPNDLARDGIPSLNIISEIAPMP